MTFRKQRKPNSGWSASRLQQHLSSLLGRNSDVGMDGISSPATPSASQISSVNPWPGAVSAGNFTPGTVHSPAELSSGIRTSGPSPTFGQPCPSTTWNGLQQGAVLDRLDAMPSFNGLPNTGSAFDSTASPLTMSSNCDPGSTGFGPQNSFIGTSPLVTPSPFSSVDQPSLRDGRQSQLTPTTPPQIQIQESASTSTILGFAKVSQPRQTTSSQAGNSGPFRKSPASGSRLRRNRVLTEEHVKDKEVIQISFMKDNLEVFFFARCSLGRAHTIADRDFAIGHQLEHHPIPPAKMMLQETVKGMGQPKRYGVFEVPQKIGSVTVKKKLQAQLHNLKGSGVQMDIGRNGLVKLGLITENFGNMHLNVPVSPSNTFGASADGPSATSHVSPASTSQFGMSFGEMSSSAHEPSDGGGWTRLEPQFPEEGLSYLYPPRGH